MKERRTLKQSETSQSPHEQWNLFQIKLWTHRSKVYTALTWTARSLQSTFALWQRKGNERKLCESITVISWLFLLLFFCRSMHAVRGEKWSNLNRPPRSSGDRAARQNKAASKSSITCRDSQSNYVEQTCFTKFSGRWKIAVHTTLRQSLYQQFESNLNNQDIIIYPSIRSTNLHTYTNPIADSIPSYLYTLAD